ncbi:MAG: Bax inhibitor-1/YccA family protein [Microbacteriaceae bacterium]
MALSNPAFSRNAVFQSGTASSTATAAATAENLQQLYEQPSASSVQMDRMTVEDTVGKSFLCFVLLVASAAVGWFVPMLMIVGLIVGLVLGLVNAFKKEPSAPLILLYAAFEGLFIGGISAFFERAYPGIVVQATLATIAVVGVTLALFASGKVRASKRATKVFFVALIGYLVFSLINFGMMMFGATDNPWGMRSVEVFGIPLGVIIGVLAVLMGAYSLVLDFDFIQRGVANRAPRKYGWTGAFGIMVTVIWLYVEILRLLAISRD